MGTSSIQYQHDTKVSQLLERFLHVRKKTEELCAPLAHEDYVISVTDDTSPPKWHLAHTTWFFEHFILMNHLPGYESFNPEFGFLFNSYYRSFGHFLKKSQRGILSRPTIEDIFQYRQEITKKIIAFMNGVPSSRVVDIFEIGINHEEQHQELILMDIKRNLFENPLRPYYQAQRSSIHHDLEETTWRTFHAGLVNIGVPASEIFFTFDNERESHKVWLESFQLSTHLVTNDEFLAFMEDGGYENPQLWLSDGWDTKEKLNWSHPLYWEKNSQDWWTYTFGGMVPLDYSAPVVHVSYYEADAYAKWKKARLPSEFEWEVAAKLEKINGYFLEGEILDPESASSDYEVFSQIHGSVWEWTKSSYAAYPRFKSLQHGLDEYNGKFMCNQYVLRGGSCLTPIKHYRTSYRNFYYPHMRWMYGGIRLARNLL